jgi:hypothetical protein
VKIITVLRDGGDSERELAHRLRAVRKERERHREWLRSQRPARKALKAAAAKRWREQNLERDRERKRKWREANRERVRAYYRNYDALTPGRREYKAQWLRERGANAA